MKRLSYCCFALALLVGSFAIADEQTDRPNIVLIMCDDMGYSDIGCYGGEVDTPNLNRMAEQGLRFTQFYNCAKCTTTRASLSTGLYPRPKGGLLKRNMVTIGEAMKTAGYATSLSGKWHLGSGKDQHPFQRGFDRYYGLLDGCCNFFDPAQPDPKYKGGRVRTFGQDDKRITEFPDDFYTTDAFTDHAIESVEKFAAAEKPFFVHICYTAPHYPLHAKEKDIAKYKGKFMMGWNEMRKQRYQRMLKMGIIDPKWKLSDEDSKSYSWEKANQEHEDLRMAVYAAMIDSMDQNIGRLLTALENTGVADNTVVMFLSDNGGCAEEPGGRSPEIIPGPKEYYAAVGPAWGWAQNAPFRRYKSWVNEGGISTPLIVMWPKQVKAGSMTNQVGHVMDFLPTCLDLAGAEYPAEYNGNDILPVDGRSLKPILLGAERDPHETICWEWSGNRAIRQGDWKCVYDKTLKSWGLFDVKEDRTETNDLSADNEKLKKQMIADWGAWAKATGNRQ